MIQVKKPEIKTQKFNLENEDKPIVEPTTRTSEDVHGGDEITQSVGHQRFAQQQASPEQEKTEKQGEQEDNEKQNETGEQEEGEEQEQGQKEQEGQREQSEQEKENENGEENGEKEKEEGQEKESEQEEGEKNETEEQEQTEQKQDQSETGKENQEEEPKEGQKQTEERNAEQVFKLEKGKLFLELYKLIEYLSDEEKTLTPEPISQIQTLNVKKLMFRQYERKQLSSYYEYRERTEIILILDTSGSMTWIQDDLNVFFSVALKRKDVQIFIAPNGVIEEKYNEKTKNFQEIEHEKAMQSIIESGLPVIYIGDYDGANTPVELSHANRVFWVCTETRYKRFAQHDWVNYSEEDFRGFFGRAWNITEIVQVLKEFAKHIQQTRFWLDLHENDIEEPEDDE